MGVIFSSFFSPFIHDNLFSHSYFFYLHFLSNHRVSLYIAYFDLNQLKSVSLSLSHSLFLALLLSFPPSLHFFSGHTPFWEETKPHEENICIFKVLHPEAPVFISSENDTFSWRQEASERKIPTYLLCNCWAINRNWKWAGNSTSSQMLATAKMWTFRSKKYKAIVDLWGNQEAPTCMWATELPERSPLIYGKYKWI